MHPVIQLLMISMVRFIYSERRYLSFAEKLNLTDALEILRLSANSEKIYGGQEGTSLRKRLNLSKRSNFTSGPATLDPLFNWCTTDPQYKGQKSIARFIKTETDILINTAPDLFAAFRKPTNPEEKKNFCWQTILENNSPAEAFLKTTKNTPYLLDDLDVYLENRCNELFSVETPPTPSSSKSYMEVAYSLDSYSYEIRQRQIILRRVNDLLEYLRRMESLVTFHAGSSVIKVSLKPEIKINRRVEFPKIEFPAKNKSYFSGLELGFEKFAKGNILNEETEMYHLYEIPKVEIRVKNKLHSSRFELEFEKFTRDNKATQGNSLYYLPQIPKIEFPVKNKLFSSGFETEFEKLTTENSLNKETRMYYLHEIPKVEIPVIDKSYFSGFEIEFEKFSRETSLYQGTRMYCLYEIPKVVIPVKNKLYTCRFETEFEKLARGNNEIKLFSKFALDINFISCNEILLLSFESSHSIDKLNFENKSQSFLYKYLRLIFTQFNQVCKDDTREKIFKELSMHYVRPNTTRLKKCNKSRNKHIISDLFTNKRESFRQDYKQFKDSFGYSEKIMEFGNLYCHEHTLEKEFNDPEVQVLNKKVTIDIPRIIYCLN